MSIKFIRQLDEKDCGPCCLAMILNFYGKKVSISELRNLSKTDNKGTNLYGMINAGKHMGLNIEGLKAENTKDLEHLRFPIIAHIINESGYEHFIIIEKIKNEKVLIIDPAKGKYKLPIIEFEKYWTRIILTVEKNEDFTKESSYPSIIKMFLSLFKSNQKFVWFIILLSILVNILSILGTFYFKFLVDSIIPANLISSLNKISLGIVILYITHSLITYIRLQLILKLSIKIDKKLMIDYFEHVLHLPISFFDTRKPGEILSRFMDTSKIRETLSSVTVTLFVDSLMVIIGGIVLYFQSSTLFFISLFFIPIYLFIGTVFRKPFEKYNREVLEQNAILSSYLIESFTGIYSIKNSNSQKYFIENAQQKFTKFMSKIFSSGFFTNLQTTSNSFVKYMATVIILWIGSFLVIKNSISLGELLTFNALITYYFTPIERLINVQPQIQTSIVAGRRLLEILELQKEKDLNSIDKTLLKNEIIFQNVNFQYGFRKQILKDVNLSFKKSEKTAIIGESGSGKSTIAKLINNYYNPNDGNIFFDKTNINDLSLSNLRNNIGYVSQNDYIFGDTILNNLLMGLDKNNISWDYIKNSCRLAEIHEFISSLPYGYETKLEPNGSNLSGGQLQRLSIARAFIKNPEIYIFDEATSALDKYTEKKIMSNINKLTNLGKTVIIITHNLNNVQDSQYIYMMYNGKVIEHGTHMNLIRNQKNYSKLWSDNNTERNR